MPELVGYLILFVALAVFFVFIHLVMGRFIRPVRPDPEKLTVYECGEPTIGSAWIQFDLRYYVVALLFVIFDVEVAFFFPWAVVFGKANTLANPRVAAEARLELTNELVPAERNPQQTAVSPEAAHQLAWIAFWDILVFFGVLLVGFAYLWRRGDINWVRSLAAEEEPTDGPPAEAAHEEPVPAGAGSW